MTLEGRHHLTILTGDAPTTPGFTPGPWEMTTAAVFDDALAPVVTPRAPRRGKTNA